jgi:acyl carrier protein
MRTLSRWMPPAQIHKAPWWAWPLLPPLLLIAALCIPIGWLLGAKERGRRRKCYLERSGKSLYTFVREFNVRNTDTWILRAVYEALSKHLQLDGQPFPIRANDRWKEDLQIDSEDLDMDLLPEIAQRAGRSLQDTKANPFFNKVKTVRDLVAFLEHQPRL